MGLIISHLWWEERRQQSYINFAWPVKCHSLFWFAAVIVSFLFQTPHCQQNVPQDAKKQDLHICIRIGKSIVLSKTPCMIKMVLRIQLPGSCKKEDGRSKITVGHHRGGGQLEATAMFRLSLANNICKQKYSDHGQNPLLSC